MPKTLYENLGGFQRIERVTMQFYQNILMDRQINTFYLENMSDIAKLHHLFAQFISMITGGPNAYTGRNMKQCHKNMAIKGKDFDMVWNHLAKAFKDDGTSEQNIQKLKEAVYQFFPDVVNTK